MKLFLGWLFLIALPAPGLAAVDVTVSRQPQPDRSVTLVHEVVVDAPLAATWTAVSTAAGWQGWAAALAWDLPNDVIETSYVAGARSGDHTTIRQQILMRVPERLLVFRTTKAPSGFRDFETFAHVTHLIELEAVGDDRTRVRLTGTGYADSVAGRRLADLFQSDNALALENLRKFLAGRAPPEPLDRFKKPD